VHALTDLYDLEIPEADAFVHEGPGDALRILTIHAAKGLEFPVVVLGDYAGKPGASPERLRALGGELRLGSGSDGLSTAGYGAVAEADEQREEHERKRQLYVAVTRARDLLVLPYLEPAPTRVRQVKAGALARHLFDPKVGHALPASLGALRAEVLEMDAATLPARSSAAVPRLDPEAVAALEPDAGGAQHRLSLLAQSRARFGGAGRLIRPSSTETSADVDPPTAAFRQGKARALALGDLAHVLVAERLGRPAPAAYLETRPADLRAAAEVLAATFLASPLAARARRAGPSLRVEEPLCLDGANGLLDGRLDLAFLEDSVWIVVDLKSDRVEAGEVEARSARYRPQAALYATALERVTGRPVAEVHLYFLAPGVDHLLAGGGWSSDCERAAMALTR
jgi:ATP-dependent exoDNAse (exonuclease V) beta subunit